ncbi:senescence-associated carboxylesterase [Salix suchowensis]|nr:senescence-associated carboxylesterase [Salix suchowensis]
MESALHVRHKTPSFHSHNYSICHRGIQGFGTFILCSERGCACVDDLVVVSRLLESTQRQDYYVEMVNDLKSKGLIRGNSQRDPSHMHPLMAGIILQLETIGVGMTTQRKVDNNNLISRLEEREKILMAERVQTMDPRKKLNQIKIKMAHLEQEETKCGWYSHRGFLFLGKSGGCSHFMQVVEVLNLKCCGETIGKRESGYVRAICNGPNQ